MSGESALHNIPLLVGVVGHRDLVPDEMPAIRVAAGRLELAPAPRQAHRRFALVAEVPIH